MTAATRPRRTLQFLRIMPGPQEPEVVEVSTEEGATYEFLRRTIGGIVQVVPLRPGLDLWCHDEGKVLRLPWNVQASLLWEHELGTEDMIAGPVVLTGGPDALGATTGLTDDLLLEVRTALADIQLRPLARRLQRLYSTMDAFGYYYG